jgi:hypothetical protein
MPSPWDEQQPSNSTEHQHYPEYQSGDVKLLAGYLSSSGQDGTDNDNVPLQNNEVHFGQRDSSAAVPITEDGKGNTNTP